MSRRFSRAVGAVIYYTFGTHLPPSWSGVRLGQTAIRRLCARLMLARCGKKVNLEKGAVFSRKATLGDRSGIGINAKIYGECHIGDDVMMGTDVTVITRNHRIDRTDIPMMDQGFEEEKPVYIGNDVWIGDRVVILPGVHIGDGSVLAAGAVVSRDIPDYSIAAGVPAKVIRSRLQDSTDGFYHDPTSEPQK
ncbi:MAG: acyltransferase [Clostridia bacterium]|nr:acyltransferase [Clostridia bacterium]MBR7061697.1 acyltransferase [Clostridia bacterium]